MDTECSSLLDRLLQVNGSTIQAASRVFSDPVLPQVGFYASACSYAGKSPVLGPRVAGLAPLCQRGLRLGRRKVNQPERHQHDNLPTSMNNILYKGKTSMASNSELEQADSTATIRLLKTKYGHTKGSAHAVVGETPSRLHWLLQGGQCVLKDHEGIGWEWAT